MLYLDFNDAVNTNKRSFTDQSLMTTPIDLDRVTANGFNNILR